MNASFSLVIPRNEYQVLHIDMRGIHHQHYTTYNALRAYSVFESYQSVQQRSTQESLVCLIVDDVLQKAVLDEIKYLSHGRLEHRYRRYTGMTQDLRMRTRQIWERAELRGIH